MTLGEFAYLLDADPKWVQNVVAALGGSLRYTLPTARRLAIARALSRHLDVPIARAYEIAGNVLARYDGSRPADVGRPRRRGVYIVRSRERPAFTAATTR